MRKIFIVAVIQLVAFYAPAIAAVTLPKIFTSNMVLQRDQPINVWGWADKGETVTVSFNGQSAKARADKQGMWLVSLKPLAAGGPFRMTVSGKRTHVDFENILIGDVFICSGQSNMEWVLNNTNNAAAEIAASNHPQLRLFTVSKATSYRPEKDLAGGEWVESNPATAGDFSAVAYFFGRKINQDIGVPVGLINSSWGGTNIQTWISWDVMSKKPGYEKVDYSQLQKDMADRNVRRAKYDAALKEDKGMQEKWYDRASDTGEWKTVNVPGLWESTPIGDADGVIWFRKEFELKETYQGKMVPIHLGPIDDLDDTYVNGTLVGSSKQYNAERNYAIDGRLLRQGKNVVIIKVTDTGGGGGIYGKPDQLFIETANGRLSLAGEWQYKKGAVTTDFGIRDTGPNSFPSQLYNAMIAPITRYGVRGGLWYQGEANAGEAFNYRTLFPEMINDWRSKWGYEFPFFWVQLANFMKPVNQPAQSDWAELREAQSMTLSVPRTGQAVIIDIGEADDIHPRNKQDVGYRLALSAEKTIYNRDSVFSGPTYSSMKKENGKIVLTFSNTGSGLMAKDRYGYLRGFSVAGADQQFSWAKAMITGNTITVWSDVVKDPEAVRYAWADNPDDANLYNKEGLPASPFRTDKWKGITEK